MPAIEYRYELCRGEQLLATGRLQLERLLEPGEPVAIGGEVGVVRRVEPSLGERSFRLVVQLQPRRSEL